MKVQKLLNKIRIKSIAALLPSSHNPYTLQSPETQYMPRQEEASMINMQS